jgi:hypothetical protein
MTDPELRRAACDYARRGWPVLPLQPHGKAPLVAHGVHGASADPAVVLRWWADRPDANIGVACGPTSGLLAVDLDGDQGLRSWARLEATHGPVLTLEQATPNGVHLVLAYPDGVDLGNTTSRLGPGIDTRAAGGYIVAAPSVHPSGHRYRWVGETIEPAPCPDWLVQALTEPDPRPAPPRATLRPGDDGRHLARFDGLVDLVAAATEGTRNARLYWAACRLAELIGEGAPPAWSDILARAGVAAGLPEAEARRTVRSGLQGVNR